MFCTIQKSARSTQDIARGLEIDLEIMRRLKVELYANEYAYTWP